MAHIFNTNLSNIAAKYVQHLNILVTDKSIKETIEQNPFYPSLYSLSNTFSKYKIETVAFEATAEQLTEVQVPFVAYMQTPNTGKDFVLITKKDNDNVTYIAQGNKEVTITQKEFLGRWQKIILVAEANSASGEMDYDKKLAKEKSTKQKRALQYIGAIAILVVLIISSFATASTNYVYNSIILFTKLSGVAITSLLLIYEIDKSNTFVKNICTAGKQTNCDAILNSGAAKFLGMSWSEVGFFYFVSTFLFFVIPGLSFTTKLPWLSFAAIAVSPYILFSIYYQYKVVKQWCPLCLATQIVLAAELCWGLYYTINSNGIIVSSLQSSTFSPSWGEIVGAVLLPIVLWYFIKPLLLNSRETTQYKAAYKRLLYHPDTFNTSLQQQQAIDGWQNLGITIGNPQAPNTILKVCNPYCGPCAKAHPVLEELIHNNDDYKLQIIFTTKPNATDEGKTLQAI
ncbi:MAG: Vitamin K epoxide reductase [Chitinophagaceae bacterium]|nr:Vitamin K epoxide reductase [Chitinophagaceae bacterium]